jgi:serine/threonine-protein kinase RsbW
MSSQPLSLCVTFSVTSGGFAARRAMAKLLEGLAPLQLDSKDADSIKMVLTEVLNNIVEHGYSNPQKPGPIGVQCTLVGNGLDIALTDTGEPPIGDAPNTNVQFADLPEGRFGWFLKKMFPQNITYKGTGSVNTLAFHLPIRITISA